MIPIHVGIQLIAGFSEVRVEGIVHLASPGYGFPWVDVIVCTYCTCIYRK